MRQNLKRFIVVVIILVLMLSVLSFYILNLMLGPHGTVTLSSADYIIYQENGLVYAKNGKTGTVELADADASKVIQYAVNSIGVNGGKIFIAKGIYYIKSTIYISEPLTIEGDGADWFGNHGTYIKGNVGIFNFEFGKTMKFMPVVKNIQFSVSSGVYAIRLGGNVSDPIIENVAAHGGIGVLIDGAVNGWIKNSWLESGDYGIRAIFGGGGFIIESNHFYNNRYASISYEYWGANLIQIHHNLIENDGGYSIYADVTEIYITDNIIYNAGKLANNTYDAIYLKIRGPAIISNNVISGVNTRYGINIAGDNLNARVSIQGNIFGKFASKPIAFTTIPKGVYLIRGNIGYTTENSGTAIIPAGPTRIRVSHGILINTNFVGGCWF